MKKKRALFVVPPSPVAESPLVRIEASMDYPDNSSPHLGLGYVASALCAAGDFDVAVYDARFEQHIPLGNIANTILSHEPDVVGFTTTTNSSNNVVRLSRLLRNNSPDIKIVVGGPHVSGKLNAHPVEKPITGAVMEELGLHTYSTVEACLRGVVFETERFPVIAGDRLVDAGVIGDCFDWAPELFHSLAQPNPEQSLKRVKGIAYIDEKNGFVFTGKRTPIKSLADLRYPSRELFPMKTYLVPGTMITSHGCPMLCSYCTCPSASDRKYIASNVGYSITEMQAVSKQFGINEFRLNDDIATINKKWMKEFSQALIELGNNGEKYRWSCFGRVDQVDKDLLEAMGRAGCVTIQYGVETGSDHILQTINKGGKATVEKAREAVQSALAAGIPLVRIGIIVGFPHDTEETLCDDFTLIDQLYNIGGDRVEVGVASLTPYPGSLDGDRAIQGYYDYFTTGRQGFRALDFNFDRYVFQEVNVANRAFPTYERMNHAYATIFGATQHARNKTSTVHSA